jgi:hypothetical protein
MWNRTRSLCTTALLVLCCTATTRAWGQGACDPHVRQLRAALLPDSGQQVNVEAVRLAGFPGVVFCRARRVPPFPHGHESRPRVATAVVGTDPVLVVTRVEDLAGTWRLGRTVAQPDSVTRALLDLLDATGVVARTQLVRSPDEAREVFHRSVAERYLRQVRSPVARQEHGRWKVRLFLVGDYGLERYDFVLVPGGPMHVKRTLFRSLLSP